MESLWGETPTQMFSYRSGLLNTHPRLTTRITDGPFGIVPIYSVWMIVMVWAGFIRELRHLGATQDGWQSICFFSAACFSPAVFNYVACHTKRPPGVNRTASISLLLPAASWTASSCEGLIQQVLSRYPSMWLE